MKEFCFLTTGNLFYTASLSLAVWPLFSNLTIYLSITPTQVSNKDSREVPESGLVGHERDRGSVFLPVSWLRQVDLLKLEGVLWLQGQETNTHRTSTTAFPHT